MKRLRFTTITPLPPTADRAAVVAVLHDLDAMVGLNPLVVARTRIPAPPGADADEADCVWYRLTDALVPWVSDTPPSSSLSKTISYTCAFLPLPDGLQTHCHAPLGVDIRDRWTIGGSPVSGPAGTGQQKRPTEARELGLDALGAPASGLYVREDVDLRCNVLLAGFVKKTLKRKHAALAARLAEVAAAPIMATSATSATTADVATDEPEDPFAPPLLGGLPLCVAGTSACRNSESPLPPLPSLPRPPPPPPKPQPEQLLLLPRTFRPPKGDKGRSTSITSLYPEMNPYVDAEVSPSLSSVSSFSSSSSSFSKYSENNSQSKPKTTCRRRPAVLFAELSDKSGDYGMVVPVLLDTREGQPFLKG